MVKRLLCTMTLLLGNNLAAMEQTKAFALEKQSSHNEVPVKILLADSHASDTVHEVALPLRLAKLLGSIDGYLQENPELKKTVFHLAKVTLGQWRLIESQLEKVHSIVLHSRTVKREIVL